ncbi:MAG: hypothetical protein M1608_12100, partial [Candidatus Omnitrophica bacterium]|nr:hypothetical protein [Candidatus Omnitrophota bacterium]
MDLAGAVRVTNNSGEDYENAQVRLVVGVIRLVQNVADLAKAGRPGPLQPQPVPSAATTAPAPQAVRAVMLNMAEESIQARPAEITKEGISEYFLYTVEGRDTIPTGWSKRLPSFKARDVPIVSYYKFEQERWGDQVI